MLHKCPALSTKDDEPFMSEEKKSAPFPINTILLLAAIICLFAAGDFSLLWAAEPVLLVDKHKAAGIACNGCHKEAPPAKAVAGSVCVTCHGAYAALAEKTGKANPNPHDSHMGELGCEQCHRVHKPSVSACARCHHEFSLRFR
jgi:hypothetical protein